MSQGKINLREQRLNTLIQKLELQHSIDTQTQPQAARRPLDDEPVKSKSVASSPHWVHFSSLKQRLAPDRALESRLSNAYEELDETKKNHEIVTKCLEDEIAENKAQVEKFKILVGEVEGKNRELKTTIEKMEEANAASRTSSDAILEELRASFRAHLAECDGFTESLLNAKKENEILKERIQIKELLQAPLSLTRFNFEHVTVPLTSIVAPAAYLEGTILIQEIKHVALDFQHLFTPLLDREHRAIFRIVELLHLMSLRASQLESNTNFLFHIKSLHSSWRRLGLLIVVLSHPFDTKVAKIGSSIHRVGVVSGRILESCRGVVGIEEVAVRDFVAKRMNLLVRELSSSLGDCASLFEHHFKTEGTLSLLTTSDLRESITHRLRRLQAMTAADEPNDQCRLPALLEAVVRQRTSIRPNPEETPGRPKHQSTGGRELLSMASTRPVFSASTSSLFVPPQTWSLSSEAPYILAEINPATPSEKHIKDVFESAYFRLLEKVERDQEVIKFLRKENEESSKTSKKAALVDERDKELVKLKAERVEDWDVQNMKLHEMNEEILKLTRADMDNQSIIATLKNLQMYCGVCGKAFTIDTLLGTSGKCECGSLMVVL